MYGPSVCRLTHPASTPPPARRGRSAYRCPNTRTGGSRGPRPRATVRSDPTRYRAQDCHRGKSARNYPAHAPSTPGHGLPVPQMPRAPGATPTPMTIVAHHGALSAASLAASEIQRAPASRSRLPDEELSAEDRTLARAQQRLLVSRGDLSPPGFQLDGPRDHHPARVRCGGSLVRAVDRPGATSPVASRNRGMSGSVELI